jgi:holo-[acyl-carrier protein] synthase
MIIGMGMDVCEIDRIEAMVERWGARFTEKLFTSGEREYAASKVKSGQHFAARFAVKEATLKALSVPKGLSWKEMEVVGGGNRPPRLELHGVAAAAAKEQGIDRLHVTISHAGGLAVAVVIAERD